MHAIKGGWAGRTFALAKNNESEGRKSRIRRSKEERKAMVESFIKTYQKLNNGSFPSLNLTHKEVGGSFYTVREIVRDIIQENRVLGPAKFTAEEQTIDHFLEQNPLGSIATEPPNTLSISLNQSQFISNQNQGRIEELVLTSDGHLATLEQLRVKGPVETEKNVAEESVVHNGDCIGPEYQMVDNGLINGNQVDLKDQKTEELTCTELRTIEPLEAEKNVEEVPETSRSKVTPIAADVIVETFPLKPANETSESLDGRLQGVTDLAISTEDRVEENLSSPLLENNSGSLDEEALGNARDPSLESSNCSTFNDGVVREKGSTDLNVKAPHKDVPSSEILEQSQLTAGPKAIKAPDSLHTNNINGTGGGSELSKTKEVLVIEDEVDVQSSGSLQKGSSPTLDRINLESWEGRSKKSAKPEGNPLWDVFKAFIDAFVKFWSE
ncbi:unnamed protein product [Prunus armeniaca]|uniref:AT3G52170-like helix-turn-helix domain-containing protein n=1 Tax=Prunus armeniaca TaxID=36596 RepID=A0A6J5WGI7_PRUAR|nr:unnamed protein product [Prunus armeniaca]